MTHRATLEATTTRQLDELLSEAHARTYRFPSDFGGFAASLTVTAAKRRAEGSVTARKPSLVTVDLDSDEDDRAWATKELASLVAHRWHQPYDAGTGRYAKATDAEGIHPLGRLVRLVGDHHASSYRVLDGHMSQIERQVGPMRSCIVVHEWAPAPDRRAVPTVFTVSYWNEASGTLARTDAYLDAYLDIDGVLLPKRRRVVAAFDDGLVTRDLRLKNHRLLPAAQGARPRS